MNRKNVTIQDIANTSKVSKSTVSRVLNNTTPVDAKKRSAVLNAMKKLNFKPNVFARTLAGGKSMTLGVVTQNIGSPFYDSVTMGIIKGLAGTKYSPIIADGQWNQELEIAAINTLIDRQIDGIIMVGGDLDSKALDEVRNGIPMVLVARKLDDWEGRCIWIDNVEAAKKATQYLIDLGHRNIAHIAGIQNHQDAIDRLLGYQQAVREAKVNTSEDLVVQGDFSGPSGVLAIETLLMRGVSFSAVFAANDEMASGVRLALHRHGIRVPEDVSIIGFDGQTHSAFMTPPLTTMSQPAIQMGQAASTMLINLIDNQSIEIPDLTADMVVRESVHRLR